MAVPQKSKSPEGPVTREGPWREDRLGSEKAPRQTSSSTGWPCDGLLLRASVISTCRISDGGKPPTSPAAPPGFMGIGGSTD